MDKQNIHQQISNFVQEYTHMDIGGITIPCPYWQNKIKNGKVVIRGYLNGKGQASEIRAKIIAVIKDYRQLILTRESIRKLAKRERIGIDCSGFVYRVLDRLVGLHYGRNLMNNLDRIYEGGINRTSAASLTGIKNSIPVKSVADMQLGDLIRMMKGKHIMIILKIDDKRIVYVHSASRTKIQGVHLGQINILDKNKSIDKQKWLEITKDGSNYLKKYFHPEYGDGVFRPKIFI